MEVDSQSFGVVKALRSCLIRLYMAIFARQRLQSTNLILLKLALHARGYNNCSDLARSGEACFLDRLRKYNPRVCIDVGANIGEYSEALLKRTGCKVIAFEPVPETYELLTRLEEQYAGRFLVVNCALGQANSCLPIRYGPSRSCLASLSDATMNLDSVARLNQQTTLVAVRTLDSILESSFSDWAEEGIDFIKIDVEGYEREVLCGARDTIAKHRPRFIQIELNEHHLFLGQNIWDFSCLLKDYDCYQLLPNGWHCIDPKRTESNIAAFSNFVFVRR